MIVISNFIIIIIIILNDKITHYPYQCIRIRGIGITIREKIPSPLLKKANLPRFNLPTFLFPRANRNELNRVSVFIPVKKEKEFRLLSLFSKFTRRDRIVIWTRNHLHLPKTVNQLYIYMLISSNFGDSYFL